MKNEGIKWIGIAGASFGGSITALYAGMNSSKVNAVCLAYPVLDYDVSFLNPVTPWGKKYFENSIERIKKDGFIKVGSRSFSMGMKIFREMSEYKPGEILQKYNGPLIIIHGDKDQHILCQLSIDCFNRLKNKNKRLEIIEGGEHGLEGEPYETETTNLIVQFFSSQSNS